MALIMREYVCPLCGAIRRSHLLEPKCNHNRDELGDLTPMLLVSKDNKVHIVISYSIRGQLSEIKGVFDSQEKAIDCHSSLEKNSFEDERTYIIEEWSVY